MLSPDYYDANLIGVFSISIMDITKKILITVFVVYQINRMKCLYCVGRPYEYATKSIHCCMSLMRLSRTSYVLPRECRSLGEWCWSKGRLLRTPLLPRPTRGASSCPTGCPPLPLQKSHHWESQPPPAWKTTPSATLDAFWVLLIKIFVKTSTLYVHIAHHANIKNQRLVIGQLKNPANPKQRALFCFFVIGWCSHIDQSQGTGF